MLTTGSVASTTTPAKVNKTKARSFESATPKSERPPEQTMASIFDLITVKAISPLAHNLSDEDSANKQSDSAMVDGYTQSDDTHGQWQGIISVTCKKPDDAAQKAAAKACQGTNHSQQRKAVECARNEDLPCSECEWQLIFVPTLFEHLGRLANPWDVQEASNLAVLQKTWDNCFPNKPHKAKHKCYVWRTAIRRNTIAAVDKTFHGCIMPHEEQMKYADAELEEDPKADRALRTTPFLWHEVRKNPDGSVKIFMCLLSGSTALAVIAPLANQLKVEHAWKLYASGDLPEDPLAKKTWAKILTSAEEIMAMLPGAKAVDVMDIALPEEIAEKKAKITQPAMSTAS
ncbi:uncharacterized protein C8Q71DRAFT_722863 [Rhodofomes roseus]|uniref:HNH nuclease domain-containing protein n=1 Tax=Rhodofomes roseus TaxID=34475 RepID=A0ABQ8KLI4_9APHY|nr:uncharacterized protein C8Q71DRAFT_722863 [Rhodofomes roseus]KAH9838770.1 hypothetical protein C8Q71DRAFT_722863 [Rhodofomes roseus]